MTEDEKADAECRAFRQLSPGVWGVVGLHTKMHAGMLSVKSKDGHYLKAKVIRVSKPFVAKVGKFARQMVRIGYL